jgi:hypothetical protein
MPTTTATARPRQRKPRQKPARFIRLCVKPDGQAPGVVRITVGKEQTDYLLAPIPADFGRGFEIRKIGLEADGEVYHVNLDGDKGTCDCKGFGRWNHCKHADGLAALIAAGRL